MTTALSDLFAAGAPPVFFAPMAGISDAPTRALAARCGAHAGVTELVSAKAFLRAREKTVPLLLRDPDERVLGAQIVGSDPGEMAEVAHEVSRLFPFEFLDLNFGCPARKVLRSGGGSRLLDDLPRAKEIVRRVVAASALPVTVKTRVGIRDGGTEGLALAEAAADLGASALFLHARSREALFSGPPNLPALADLVRRVKVPVVGNGGIRSGADALAMARETGCAGVMIGRGSYGRPWLFGECADALATGSAVARPAPGLRETFRMLRAHAEASLPVNGAKELVPFRKHMLWYTRGFEDSARLRTRLTAVSTLGELDAILRDYLARTAACDA